MYRLTKFKGFDIPELGPLTDWNTPDLRGISTQTAGGAFIHRVNDRARLNFPYTIQHRCSIHDEGDKSAVIDEIDSWRGLVGEPGTLERLPLCDSEEADKQTVDAILTSARYSDDHIFPYAQMILEFSILWYWQGIGDNPWELDSGVDLDDGRDLDEGIATTFTIADGTPGNTSFTNPGTVPTEDIFLSITAGSAGLEKIILYAGFTNALWFIQLGTGGAVFLEAGETITIDTSRYEILKNGLPAYSDFQLSPYNHNIDAWMRILPGANVINWFADGGGGDTELILNWKPEYL